MDVEIITIGDELLIGQVVDTNGAWMGNELNNNGFWVKYRTAVGDYEEDIIAAIDQAKKRVRIILITGGLGPTTDDLTKEILCKYFDCGLRFDQKAYDDIAGLFKARGREVTEPNRQQAFMPELCKTIYNENGTAPGMWFENEEFVLVSMPGVPFEMQGMMINFVIPELKSRFKPTHIIHKTIMTQGIGESFLSGLLIAYEKELPANIKLAYLPAVSSVRLRLTARGSDASLATLLKQNFDKLESLVQPFVYGYDNEKIESVLGRTLIERKQSLSTAESCTGGLLAASLVSIAGSSAYYKGSVVAYDNEVKINSLNVPAELIKVYGAVSEPVAKAMAENVRIILKTDFSIATTGIAGPDGGSSEKPVGTIWIAIAGEGFCEARKFNLGRNRNRVIEAAVFTGINMLLRKLKK